MSNQDLKVLSEDIKSRLGISDEMLKKLENVTNLGGKKKITFTVPITKGSGKKSEKETTYGVTIHGAGTIVTPDSGKWHIIAKENDKIFIDVKDVTKGQKIPFKTSTAWTTTFEIIATWSQQDDATLTIVLDAEY